MRRLRGAAVVVAGGLAVFLAACQAPQGGPQDVPSTAVAPNPASTSQAPVPEPTPSPPAPGTVSPPALSAEEQAQLDQELIAAAKANNAPLVKELISRGGNVNAKDSIQDSAFLYAGAEGFNEVLQLTLAAGADVASINRYGGTALIPASEHGHVETVRILIAAGVPVNHVNNLGWTAMQEAILLNDGGPRQQEVVRLLLEAGADPDIRDPEGRTALQNAERLGFGEIAALIRGR
ncbi:ankyrin repeat domain-containing protein [Arthrobacter sp. RT-1]|uniref:ankyrin repeat domain-containing protein n=1 Tax=Arthrobacter sp. RT-1 TaxID=2292263 RepID=UPI002163DFA8|nr:ankyrin repeat domain-containing protein [Arthrobacter sp. RT-1]